METFAKDKSSEKFKLDTVAEEELEAKIGFSSRMIGVERLEGATSPLRKSLTKNKNDLN